MAAAAVLEANKQRHQIRLVERANKMYEMLVKIASDTEEWTISEVRELLSSIYNRRVFIHGDR